jgi:hypothetical protein
MLCLRHGAGKAVEDHTGAIPGQSTLNQLKHQIIRHQVPPTDSVGYPFADVCGQADLFPQQISDIDVDESGVFGQQLGLSAFTTTLDSQKNYGICHIHLS